MSKVSILDMNHPNPYQASPVWPDGKIILSIFSPLQQWIFAQQHKKFSKVGSQFCQILNKLSRNCQRLKLFCQRGEFNQIRSHWKQHNKCLHQIKWKIIRFYASLGFKIHNQSAIFFTKVDFKENQKLRKNDSTFLKKSN